MPINRIREKINIIEEQEENNQYNIDRLVNSIIRLYNKKSLVPVICEDMYEYINPVTNEHQSLHSYLVEKVIEQVIKPNDSLSLTETELNDIVNGGYYGMSLLREKIRREIFEEIHGAIFDNNVNINEGIHLKQEVQEF